MSTAAIPSQPAEVDINDAFDDIFLSEEILSQESYDEGLEIGRKEGNTEAYHFGYHRGAELGAELGYYYGVVCASLKNCSDAKKQQILGELKTEIEDFPKFNDIEKDLVKAAQDIRIKFKKFLNQMEHIKNHIDFILGYLEPHQRFINCHMVNCFTNNHWENFIKPQIRDEIHTEDDVNNHVQLFWDQRKKVSNSAFSNFVEESKKYRIESIEDAFISIDQLKDVLSKNMTESTLNVSSFMSEKKNHEVEITAAVVASLCDHAAQMNEIDINDVVVIDVGAGKGYLSSRIALEYKIKVLGVDSNMMNTINAEIRNTKLSKAWPSLRKKAAKNDERVEEPSPKVSEKLYKSTTQLIHAETDLIEMVAQEFPDINSKTFCLCGLHTCGNLASNSLRIFNENESIRSVCNVGCCYHLLVEEFGADPFFNETKLDELPDFGFPLSNYLRGKKYRLGRNARMLAAQSIDRVVNNCELPNKTLGYRALLEVLLRRHSIADIKVGKIKCTNFREYALKCLKKFKLEGLVSESEIEELEKSYSFELKLLEVFYLIRQTFSPIIESLILFDRLLFLKENGHDRSFIVKLFDPVISPRCYAILSLK